MAEGVTPLEPQAYRPDIDGLRAVAVLAVVGYHAFPRVVTGGFVGVDVFFVISGFLISGQLLEACRSGTFSFRDFYVRRVRRLAPALLLVLAATALVGWFVLMPDEYSALQTHVAASTFFGNNIVLWTETGYFDGPSELKPLLHLWSLGIEEQFYLVWPLFIWLAWRRKWSVIAAMAAVATVSFAANVALILRGRPEAAFFLPTSRMWELALGALLAAAVPSATPPSTTATRRTVMSLAGCALVFVSTIALSRELSSTSATTMVGWQSIAAAYPGWWALAPTIGTALVIAAGADAWSNASLLSSRPLVAIGLISYPLYLWHWPMISFLSITELREVPVSWRVGAILLAMVLAALTFVAVERPVRRSISVQTPWRAAALVAPLIALGFAATSARLSGTFLPPFRTAARVDEGGPRTRNEAACRARFAAGGDYCQVYMNNGWPVTTALVGDSHSQAALVGVGRRLEPLREDVVQLGQAGCPPLLDLEQVRPGEEGRCVAQNRRVVEGVARDPGIRQVLLVFRGAQAAAGHSMGPGEPNPIRFRIVGTEWSNQKSLAEGLRRTVAFLIGARKHVIIALPAPELAFHPVECTGRPFSFRPRPRREPCGTAAARVREYEQPFRDVVKQVGSEFPVQVFDPRSLFCDDEWCSALLDGRLAYWDDNHLGMYGSTVVAHHLVLDAVTGGRQ